MRDLFPSLPSLITNSLRMYSYQGRALDLELNVHGAPNFRSPREGHLNVFGVAQPRTQGLRGILSVLRCRPNIPNSTHVVWFCTREEPIGTFLYRIRKFMLDEFVELIQARPKYTYPDVHLCSEMPASRDGP